MANFLLYWRPETVEADDDDRIQWWAGSEWIGKDDVRPGDVIWVVSSFAANDLRLVARITITVARRLSREAAPSGQRRTNAPGEAV